MAVYAAAFSTMFVTARIVKNEASLSQGEKSMVKPIPNICTRVSCKTLGKCCTTTLLRLYLYVYHSACLLTSMCRHVCEESVVIHPPTLPGVDAQVADLLASARRERRAWGNTAVVCRHWRDIELCITALIKGVLPNPVCKSPASELESATDHINVLTPARQQGLEFPFVVMVSVGHISAS